MRQAPAHRGTPRPVLRPRAPWVWALAWLALALWALPTGLQAADAGSADNGLVDSRAADIGAAIYLQGITGNGQPLRSHREGAAPLEGAQAACVNCHRRSGFGGQEGRNSIPPITARYLFRARAGDADRDIPYVPGMRTDREPYDAALLARAIREGQDAQDRPLNYLMPQFDLGDADMAALIAYLHRMDKRHVPGVGEGVLHFATIITPDTDPARRQAMLSVMRQFFADRNARQLPAAPRMLTSGHTAYSKSMFRMHPQWELHVWELSGPPSGWQQQLDKHLAREPVLAVLSGLGGSNWAPVHAFCEAAAVPCLFPNVELPVEQSDGNYALYFSKGVLLEAELMAAEVLAQQPRPSSVLQVWRSGDVGEAAARAAATLLQAQGLAVRSLVLDAQAGPDALRVQLPQALAHSAAAPALLLWLRPPDLASLPSLSALSVLSPAQQQPLPQASLAIYLSGLMGGLENSPLPADWRSRSHMAYPFDLPEARRVRVDFARGWFYLRKIAVVDLQMQADTYLACGLLSETLNHMADNLDRDYLIERVQALLEHRIVTGYYPRLALANGQHFASKGGYLVHFAEDGGTRLVAEHEWQVP